MRIQIIDMSAKAEHIPVFVGKDASRALYVRQKSTLAEEFVKNYFAPQYPFNLPSDRYMWEHSPEEERERMYERGED